MAPSEERADEDEQIRQQNLDQSQDGDKLPGNGRKKANNKRGQDEIDGRLKSICEQMGIIPGWMLTRTDLCKHKYGCYENVVIGLYRTFVNGLALKLFVNNISYITNMKKLFKNLTSMKSNKDNLRFALFLAVMNASYKLALCFLRRYLKSDKLAAPIAGFIAGLFSALDIKARRQFATVLLLSRLSDAGYSMAEVRGYARRITYGEVIVWVICNVTQQYAMVHETDILNRGQMGFMKKWALIAKNQEQMIEYLNKKCRDDIAKAASGTWRIVNFGLN